MRELLAALADSVVPPDEFPGARELGAVAYVERRLQRLSERERERFDEGMRQLEREAEVGFGRRFEALTRSERHRLLVDLDRGRTHADVSWDASHWFSELRHWVIEAVYASPASPPLSQKAGAAPLWGMIGYPSRPPPVKPSSTFSLPQDIADEYDVIVIGAGVSGSIVAGLVAEAGHRVLVLERGDHAFERAARESHLSNHRLSLYGHNTGPPLSGHPRVYQNAAGDACTVNPADSRYHNNAMCVGGGALVYGGMAWRFHPKDFRMQSEYGRPSGSSLADWPIDYEELAPYYERAEWEIGVAGGARPPQVPVARAYPMPAHPGHPGRQALARGAASLGWRTHGVPLLINSVARQGRSACVRCSACVGFACPSDAKNGGHNGLLERALLNGHATLLTHSMVTRLASNEKGGVVGVHAIVGAESEQNRPVTLRARQVVVCCGAIESARLLLASKTARETRGIGNDADQVGRHLQGHVYSTATGLMPEVVDDFRGPGPSVATSEFVHDNPGILGGGLLSDDFVLLPIVAYRDHLPPDLLRFGLENKRFMREALGRLLKVTGPVQEVPSPESRVTLDASVVDRHGGPVARLSGSVHPETLRSAEFLRQRASEWLQASGALQVWSSPLSSAAFLSAGQHQAGTCRMGSDPCTSVTDPYGRVHGHDNLRVIDASVHVTNGGYNPVLTVMALAFRNSQALVSELG